MYLDETPEVFQSKKTFEKPFKLEEGDNVFRILPAVTKTQGEKGRWNVYWAVHWGYKNSAGKLRPFASCEEKDYKTKTVTVVDPAVVRIEQLQRMYDEAKDQNNAVNMAKIAPLLKRYTLNKKYYVNAMDMAGKISILPLPYTVKTELEKLLDRLNKEDKVNGLSPSNGRFFVIHRSGSGFQTKYSVRVAQKSESHPQYGTIKIDMVSTLNESDINRVINEARDLTTLFKKPTQAEIERMVREGEPAVDEILGVGGKQEDIATEDDLSFETPSFVALSQPAFNVAQQAVHTVQNNPHNAPQPISLAQQPVTIMQPKPVAPTPVAPAPIPAYAMANPNSQSDADFLASLGV